VIIRMYIECFKHGNIASHDQEVVSHFRSKATRSDELHTSFIMDLHRKGSHVFCVEN
jgi:hypothetical protein